MSVTMNYSTNSCRLAAFVLLVTLSLPCAAVLAAIGSDTSSPILVDVVVPQVSITPIEGNLFVQGDELTAFHWTTADDNPGELAADFVARVVTVDGVIGEISYYLTPAEFEWIWRVPENTSAVAWLEVYCYDLFGNLTMDQSDAFTILPSTVAVPPTTPAAVQLSAPHPNPFNPTTTIAFELPESGEASLIVYDVKGRQVRRLAAGLHTAGHHSASWDGHDDDGRRVAGEVFLAVLVFTHEGRSERQVQKMVYIP